MNKTYKVTDIIWDLDYYVDESELNLKEYYVVSINETQDMTQDQVEQAISYAVHDICGHLIFTAQYEPVLEGQVK